MWVTPASGSCSRAGDIAAADVATAKAKATLVDNLIIVSTHMSGPTRTGYVADPVARRTHQPRRPTPG
jgi:hypothetical protein